VTALDRLRQVAELLPAGASVTVSREALLEALGGDVEVQTCATPSGDLTVTELAAHFKRSASTVRGWLEAGRFPGAYKLNGRDWRTPFASVEAFEKAQREPKTAGADLGAWRKHRRSA
jgi:hypothetical protein